MMDDPKEVNFHKQFEADFLNEFLDRLKKSTQAGLFSWTSDPTVVIMSAERHIEVSLLGTFTQDITKPVILSPLFGELAAFLDTYDFSLEAMRDDLQEQHAANISAFGATEYVYSSVLADEEELDEDEGDVEMQVADSIDTSDFDEEEGDEEDEDEEVYAIVRLNGFRNPNSCTFMLNIVIFADHDDTLEIS